MSGLTKSGGRHKCWLQRNRIDAGNARVSFRIMERIELKQVIGSEPLLCEDCGGLMRLVGSEPHPVRAKTDLLTYACTACDEFLVLPAQSWN